MKLKFNPRRMRPPSTLESADIGMFLKWLDVNMGSMPAHEREKAKLVHRALRFELRDRRAVQREQRARRRADAKAQKPPSTSEQALCAEDIQRLRHFSDI
jgi:hypothetical protein